MAECCVTLLEGVTSSAKVAKVFHSRSFSDEILPCGARFSSLVMIGYCMSGCGQ